jgi:hypothetical protein
MIATSLVDAVATLAAALDVNGGGVGPDGVPLHVPPMDQRPMGLPAIILTPPDIVEHVRAGCGDPHWRFTTEVVVVAESTVGLRLLGITDAVITVLDGAGYKVTSSSVTTYDVPDFPAPIPALSLTVE